jgi:hypothetical protein
MVITESIRSLTKQTTYIIFAHTILLIINGYAHEKIDVIYTLDAYMPLLIFLCTVPLVAVSFLSTQHVRLGSVTLLGILPAILFYIIVARFTALPPITILEPVLSWKILYEGSFGLILVLEVIAFWLVFKIRREIYAQMNKPTEDISKQQ